MSELRATLAYARLEMFIPYPAEMLAALRADDEKIAAAIASMPEFARPLVKPFREFSPNLTEDSLDWPAIRAEFSRKAKKIGLTAHNDVSFTNEKDGWLFWCNAKGRGSKQSDARPS